MLYTVFLSSEQHCPCTAVLWLHVFEGVAKIRKSFMQEVLLTLKARYDLNCVIGPILWGHSGPLCHALSLLLSLSWTSMRRQRVTVAACDSSDTW